jgi:hypothetical protein
MSRAFPGLFCRRGRGVIKAEKIRVLAALVTVVAVATVLITPDPSDDIHGIVHPNKIIKTVRTFATFPVPILVPVLALAEQSYLDFPAGSTPRSVLRMICTYRC